MRTNFTVTLFFLLVITTGAVAQWKVIPVPKINPAKRTVSSSRTNASPAIVRTPLTIPFWDDFSHRHTGNYPDSTHWVDSESVVWNYGTGINPPSLGVVTFNGLDSLGSPYDISNPLAKAFGDKLVSWPIKLGELPDSLRNFLYLSFFYQYQGNGEPPDAGDYLLVEFKTDTASWIPVAQINVDTVEDPTVFKPILIKITNPSFLHDQFQFRVRSFGRVSGPWDTWNLDYFYVNRFEEPAVVSFPDRTIVNPPSSLFGDYWSIPALHFLNNPDTSTFQQPVFTVTNLRQNQLPLGQFMQYTPRYTIQQWFQGAETDAVLPFVTRDILAPDGTGNNSDVKPNEKRIVPIKDIPAKSNFNSAADSMAITLKLSIISSDNLDSAVLDYTKFFKPLDFRVNDTIAVTQKLTDYYAYDDGSAEFAAGLNQPGTEMAYRFDMKNDTISNLIGVDLYFPNVGDQSNQTIILTVRADTTTTGVLYQDTLIIQRSAFDRFVRVDFFRNIHVDRKIFIGWVQTSSVLVAVGLDTSHDTADKIFYNVNGYWQSHPDLTGSLMIRPHFNGNVVYGLEDAPLALDVFPNPNSGSFYLTKDPDAYEVLDFTGRKMNTIKEGAGDHVQVTLEHPVSGLYLLKARIGSQSVTRRVIVQGPAQ